MKSFRKETIIWMQQKGLVTRMHADVHQKVKVLTEFLSVVTNLQFNQAESGYGRGTRGIADESADGFFLWISGFGEIWARTGHNLAIYEIKVN